jgi:hypothetical protein
MTSDKKRKRACVRLLALLCAGSEGYFTLELITDSGPLLYTHDGGPDRLHTREPAPNTDARRPERAASAIAPATRPAMPGWPVAFQAARTQVASWTYWLPDRKS